MSRQKKTSQQPLAMPRRKGSPSPGLEHPSHVESQHALRRLFWDAAYRVCPEAFDELLEIPIPQSVSESDDYDFEPRTDEEKDLDRAVVAWCEKHRLHDAGSPRWVVEWARQTLVVWTADPRLVGHVTVLEAFSRPPSSPPVLISPTEGIVGRAPMPPKDPNERARAGVWERTPEGRLELVKWVKTPERRLEPAEWTARHRFLRATYVHIWESLPEDGRPTPDAVRKAINTIAADLELPHLRAGRPRA